eukprot:COSAG06_NODE_38629_length_421_cov_1.083851_1_plen_22_part_10
MIQGQKPWDITCPLQVVYLSVK